MSNVQVQIIGLDELAAATKQMAGKTEDAARSEFKRVGDQVASQVRGRVPKRTGRLAGSVSVDQLGEGAAVGMGEGVAYAEYVEYGGRGHPHSAQGNYLYPAAMDAEPLLVAAGERAAEQAIGATSWPQAG